MFPMKRLHHGFLVDSQNSAIRHCSCSQHAKRLAKQANFTEEVSVTISLSLSARVKRPGEELISMPAQLSAVEERTADEVDAYERLLRDAMHGDAMLVVREDAVEAGWAIVEPILANATTLHPYEPGSWGPPEADRFGYRCGRLA
jgi:glucose-6-phosphate 1-dehydrogenase